MKSLLFIVVIVAIGIAIAAGVITVPDLFPMR